MADSASLGLPTSSRLLGLPSELKVHIASYLDLDSLKSVRLSSVDMADNATPTFARYFRNIRVLTTLGGLLKLSGISRHPRFSVEVRAIGLAIFRYSPSAITLIQRERRAAYSDLLKAQDQLVNSEEGTVLYQKIMERLPNIHTVEFLHADFAAETYHPDDFTASPALHGLSQARITEECSGDIVRRSVVQDMLSKILPYYPHRSIRTIRCVAPNKQDCLPMMTLTQNESSFKDIARHDTEFDFSIKADKDGRMNRIMTPIAPFLSLFESLQILKLRFQQTWATDGILTDLCRNSTSPHLKSLSLSHFFIGEVNSNENVLVSFLARHKGTLQSVRLASGGVEYIRISDFLQSLADHFSTNAPLEELILDGFGDESAQLVVDGSDMFRWSRDFEYSLQETLMYWIGEGVDDHEEEDRGEDPWDGSAGAADGVASSGSAFGGYHGCDALLRLIEVEWSGGDMPRGEGM
ncbi:hypothetical protein EJ08DRAFT_700472 [Tothia fuscella]|uniref:F-box domain-containing protein n=1 Tax=Tothia fuscella TaxID=1048955 RepID=A0A9P4NKF9_9PEZI|nr:hypothetical protein EJ08DRAFT_700472 [Tothia fuscella]